ncbi:MAG TPA: LytR C-terminal domain-containing protein [Gaiellaceae bacterium]|nr:LytR C-terminal domain-containing protein [Gaiellaceae bacterium]
MELARPVDPAPAEQSSVLATLRLQRKLTVHEAATRAALWPDQVEWLEEGRLYRFPSSEAAVMALLRYTTALGIDHREARKLAGLPVEPPPRRPIARWIAVGAAAALLAVLSAALILAFGRGSGSAAASHASTLPPPWRFTTDVLNGGGDINYTRQVATRIASFGYRIGHVTKAGRFDYPRTVIYFEPGGEAAARRLASQLGCGTVSPLPGGKDSRRIVVVTGRPSATC